MVKKKRRLKTKILSANGSRMEPAREAEFVSLATLPSKKSVQRARVVRVKAPV